MPNFVDLATGGWGGTIQDPLNSSQTPTMANFATLADALAGCVTQVTPDACSKLFAAATGPKGDTPADTLSAAQSIAKYPWYQPQRTFALLEQFYPVPKGKIMRQVPYMPYLNFSPSAWVLPLKFDGGGYRAGGKAMFDSQGNLWVGSNFTVGWQAQDTLWQGNFAKFDPNGRPLSPITTGFSGGGFAGGTFGAAVDANDNVWLTSYGGKAISKFDKNGKSLAGPDGITFNGQLGLMQGVIVTPSSDVWVLGLSKGQLIHFPKGDPTKGRIICEGRTVEPCKSFVAPFHLGIDQQDRIWVTNAFGAHVTRFPASDPTKVEKFKTGYSGSGLAIDSQGNVWVTNRLGSSLRGAFDIVDDILVLKTGWQRRRSAHARDVEEEGRPRQWQRHASTPRRHPVSRLAVQSAAAFPVRGRRSWTATTTSGSPTSRCRTARSRNCAVPASRIVRRVSRPAIRSRRPAATWAAACRCRPTSRSARRATCGR